MSEALRHMASQARRWRENPNAFAHEVLHVEPDAWQQDVLRAFAVEPRIALKACKGPGKTFLEGICVYNFLTTRPHPKVVCTSITGDNLSDCLWTELAVLRSRSPLLKELFEHAAESISLREHPDTWFASARTWPKSADRSQQAASMAGIHGDYTLVVIDEVSDIPDGVVVAAEASLSTGIENKILIAGNPTRTDGPLYRVCVQSRAHWWVYEITGDPDDPKRAPRISVDWARKQIQDWGADNPWVLVNVYGRFPPTQSDKLLGPEDVGEAARRTVGEAEFQRHAKVLGVDPARFGADRSVIFPRQGPVLFRANVFRGLATDELGDQVMRVASSWEADAIFIDGVGVGAGVVDHVRRHGFNVVEVNNGNKAVNPDRFANKWSEMWWDAAAWVKRGCIPNDPALLAELQAPSYGFDKAQRLEVESNKDIKARLGYSLDLASAFLCTFAAPVLPANRVGGPLFRPPPGHGHRVVHDFDPLAEAS